MNDNKKYLSVTALTKYLKYKFDSDPNLRTVFLKGEISNFKGHTTGHLYFSIKDDNSKINAIMFSGAASKLTFKPNDGDKVLLVGRVSVYESTGSYQIYVDEMLPDGVGNLYLAFEKLKEDLRKEGLFNEELKKPIPKYPKRIGVITAPTGAAIRDILSTIKRRYPIGEVIIFPSLVQGDQASKDIVKNIKLAENYNLDVLIVGRGGGSIEDLWPFNEEIVARTIYSCPIPVISGTGHEVDFTIADFVADYRAETPTGAAEKAVPNINDVINYIDGLEIRLNKNITNKLNSNKLILDRFKNSFILKNPKMMYENKKILLDGYNEKLIKALNNKLDKNLTNVINLNKRLISLNPVNTFKNKVKDLENKRTSLNILMKHKLETESKRLDNLIDKIEILNPVGVLKRGYSITYLDNKLISSTKDININDNITIKLSDGNIKANVLEKKDE